MPYDEFIKSDVALEYAMLRVEEFANDFISESSIYEATEEKVKEATPAQKQTFKQRNRLKSL